MIFFPRALFPPSTFFLLTPLEISIRTAFSTAFYLIEAERRRGRLLYLQNLMLRNISNNFSFNIKRCAPLSLGVCAFECFRD